MKKFFEKGITKRVISSVSNITNHAISSAPNITRHTRKSAPNITKYAVSVASGLAIGLTTLLGTTCFASSTVDVTPPWGRLKIVGGTEVNNINYVERTEIEVEIYANDDYSEDSAIKYHISTEPISDTEPLADGLWKTYSQGVKETIDLPNVSGLNTIYAIFKDGAGNTSLIYNGTDTQYTIHYDANGGTEAPPDAVGYFGLPLVVTNHMPVRDGYYFLGWSTNASATTPSYRQNEIVPASVFTGTNKTITLYAIWTTSTSDLPLLIDMVKVGDYVNYPVFYDNVNTIDDGTMSTYRGWRVISKDIDLDGNESPGTVNLVSAGVPLTFYHANNSTTAVTALTTNFLTTPFEPTGDYKFRKTGFAPYLTMAEVFTNEFTEMDGTNPKVRAMKNEDVLQVTGATEMATGWTLALNNAKYQNLFAVGGEYCLASAYNASNLWRVYAGGDVYYSNVERGVRPVVSLKSTVKAAGTDMIGSWNIEM